MTRGEPTFRTTLTIHAKMVIAILAVVVVVSGGTLFLVHRVLTANYHRTLDEQYHRQVDLFFQRQQERAASMRRVLRDAASSVRVVAAIQAANATRLYSDLGYELSDFMDRFRGEEAGPFFRYLDQQGTMLPAADSSAGTVAGLSEPALAEQLLPLSLADETERRYDVGRLVLPPAQGERLYSVMVVALFDPDNDAYLGDIVFAVPVSTIGSLVGRSPPGLTTGLVVADRVYSDEIPAEAHDAIRQASRPDPASAPDPITINSVPHLVTVKPIAGSHRFPRAHYVTLYSLHDMQNVMSEIQSTTIAFISTALCIGILISIVLVRRLTRPVLALVRGTGEVQKGNYSVRLPVLARDEIGLLTNSFNSMIEDLALKDKYRSVLDKVADPDIANELMQGRIQLGGELRTATVLFCDIRGFTPLTLSMGAEAIVRLLNDHMTVMTGVVGQYRGVVDKFVADEIMALFGVPRTRGDDARAAVECAQAMIQARRERNASVDVPVEIGIGIATGEMVAGCMGSENRLNYTVIGKNVNMASRLCSTARPMEALMDEATFSRIQGTIRAQPVRGLSLKGIGDGITAYRLD